MLIGAIVQGAGPQSRHCFPPNINRMRSKLSLRGGAVADAFKHVMGPESNIVEAVAEKLGRNLHNTKDHPLQVHISIHAGCILLKLLAPLRQSSS